MKGPRDRGHADHASARSPSQVARYQRIVGICRETSIGNSTRRRGQQADLKIRPTCHPRDRHVRYRSAAADPPLGVCTIRYSVQREINSPLVVLRTRNFKIEESCTRKKDWQDGHWNWTREKKLECENSFACGPWRVWQRLKIVITQDFKPNYFGNFVWRIWSTKKKWIVKIFVMKQELLYAVVCNSMITIWRLLGDTHLDTMMKKYQSFHSHDIIKVY